MISIINSHEFYEQGEHQHQHQELEQDLGPGCDSNSNSNSNSYSNSNSNSYSYRQVVEMSIAANSHDSSTFETFSQESRDIGFTDQEQDILQQMMKSKVRKRASGVKKQDRRRSSSSSCQSGSGSGRRRRRRSRRHSHTSVDGHIHSHASATTKFSDSLVTAATEIDSPYLMSADDLNSVASQSQPQSQQQSHESTDNQSQDSVNDVSASSVSASFSAPLKRRLSRDEENAFMMSENTGDFCGNDSFGSIGETSFHSSNNSSNNSSNISNNNSNNNNCNINNNINRKSPSSRKGLLSRSCSASSLNQSNSKRSLYMDSVNETKEVTPGTMMRRHKNDTTDPSISPPQHQQYQNQHQHQPIDVESVDISLDSASIFEDRRGKKLTPVKESNRLKKKKSTRSLRSTLTTADTPLTESITTRKKSSSKKKKKKKKTTPPSPKSAFAESADDILKRWNHKIDLIEQEVEALDKADNRYQEESSGDVGLKAPRELFVESSQGDHFAPPSIAGAGADTTTSNSSHRLKSPRSHMTRHLSVSCLSFAGSSLSGDSITGKNMCTKITRRQSHQGGSTSVPRRPSLHSLFEWNKQPSQSNLDINCTNRIVVNTSREPDRRQRLRRCMSTTDINQYNNTPHWPPSRRQTNRGLHSQFYRREHTSLRQITGPNVVNRSVETSPVMTSQQMLEVMEPVTMREVLAFSGLGGTKKQGSRKLVNYGDILDNQSSSTNICSLRGL